MLVLYYIVTDPLRSSNSHSILTHNIKYLYPPGMSLVTMPSSSSSMLSDLALLDTADPGPVEASPGDSPSEKDSPIGASEEHLRHFREAIEDSDVAKLEALLNLDPKLLFASFDWEITEDLETSILSLSPLALAVVCQRIPVVDFFLGHEDALSGVTEVERWSALHLAVRYNFQESLDLLTFKTAGMTKYPEIDQPDHEGMTALHIASQYGRVESARALLDAGASLDARNNQKCTPFHVACMYDQVDVLEVLWDRGPPCQMSDENVYGSRPLELAVFCGEGNAATWLVQHGADMSHPIGENKKTILHLACANGLSDMVKLLLEQGADIHEKDANLNTPLLQSCWDLQPHIFSLLHDEGALVSDVGEYDRNGFHMVVLTPKPFSKQHRDVLELLVGGGADINKRDIFGFSPLYHACKEQKADLIEILFDLGADIDQKTTHNGLTPLMEACCSPSKEPVEILLRKGANLSPRNPHGLTALSLACVNGCVDHVDALIARDADVAAHDHNGHRPLCTAAIHGQTNVMLRILKSQRYYPPDPVGVRALADCTLFTTSQPHDTEVEQQLLHAVEENSHEITSLDIIMYWAVVHGRVDLARRCISSDVNVLYWQRQGATWLHVAAQHAHPQLITELFSALDVCKGGSNEITPLHLAVVSGSLETVLCLIKQIRVQALAKGQSASKACTKVILGRDSQGASPLTTSIHLEHANITELFWEKIREFGTCEKTFMQDNPSEAVLILETLAQYEQPGNEKILKHLLEQWCTNSFFTEGQRARELTTPLEWAIYCCQPTVVWWLLSKEDSLSYRAISYASRLVRCTSKAGMQKIMDDLLQSPLPITSNISNPNPRLELPTLLDTDDPALKSQGTIVEMFSDGKIRSTQNPNTSIRDIIYGIGPDQIMQDAEDLNYLHFNTLKRKIIGSGEIPSSTRIIFNAPSSLNVRNHYGDGPGRSLKIRWIHLQANKVRKGHSLLSNRRRKSANEPPLDSCNL